MEAGNATSGANDPKAQAIWLTGRVGAADFPQWMQAHARKLGVRFDMIDVRPDRLGICATGPQDMLDAFALACSLGPKSVCVDTLQVIALAENDGPDAISGS